MSQTRFADNLSVIDQIVKAAPNDTTLAQFVNLVQDSALRRYAFDHLADPAWLSQLARVGFFQNPPKPIADSAQQTVAFPAWAESRCLARLANVASDEVFPIILRLPDTENSQVYEDMIQATLAMPPALAVQIVPQAKRWCESRYGLLIPQTMGKLMAFLSQRGYVQAGLELAASLLRIMPTLHDEDKAKTTEYRLPPEPHAGASTWAYQELLEKYVPTLTIHASIKALALLCNLLSDALRYSLRKSQEDSAEDYSYIWLPDIEADYAQHSRGLKDLLVKAVREAATQIVAADETQLESVLALFDTQRWIVYRRLTLYMLHRFPAAAQQRIISELLKKSNFDQHDCHREYGALLQEQFGFLTPEQQGYILKWIESGPDIEGWERRRTEQFGQPTTEEEKGRALRYWQYEWLQRFHTRLPAEWQTRYIALIDEFGVKEPFDPHFVEITSGLTSPKTLEELQSMSPEKVVDYLRTWQPSDDNRGDDHPTIAGLGQHLNTLVAAAPDMLAPFSVSLKGVEPTYIRSFLMGLREAVQQRRTFLWQPVLELCAWTVRLPRQPPKEDKASMVWNRDPDVGWARVAVVDLIEAGCQEGASEIPFSLRTFVWEALVPVTDDPDPTPEIEARYGGSNMDAPTLSLNTTRGKAMHALIRYALWVHRHMSPERGFEKMPEVRDVLTGHLDLVTDPSLAIRAVYGQWFPWLVMMDEHWAKANVSLIFSRQGDQRAYWEAAWRAYILFCHAYSPVFDILQEEYSKAVKGIATFEDDNEDASVPEIDNHLASHLMAYYWRGKLALHDPSGLLNQFYASAGNALRGYALTFIGNSLHDTPQVIAPDVIDRLKQLWERRLAVAQAAEDKTVYRGEMAAFGWWFASQKFEDRWALPQLLEALRLLAQMPLSGRSLFHSDQEVVQRLNELVSTMSLQVLECLRLLIEADAEGWHIQIWEDKAHALIEQALQQNNIEVQEAAMTLADRITARGFFGFRDLVR